MNTTAMTTTNGVIPQSTAVARFSFEEKNIIKDVIAKGATDAELKVFLAICERTGLDPFARQIYCIKRWEQSEGKYVMTPQVSIDGLRILAERTGKYVGFIGPQWCGEDGVWRDVWLSNDPPKAARFGVQKEGVSELVWAVARWGSYVQTTKEGKTITTWAKMPDVMLGNAAERLALRRAFPYDLAAAIAVSEPDANNNSSTEEDIADFEIVEESPKTNSPELATQEDHDTIDGLLRQYKGLPLEADLTNAKRDLIVWVSVQTETDPAKMTKKQAEVVITRLREKIAKEQKAEEEIPLHVISDEQISSLMKAATTTGFSEEEITRTLQARWGIAKMHLIPADGYIIALNLFGSKQWLADLRPEPIKTPTN